MKAALWAVLIFIGILSAKAFGQSSTSPADGSKGEGLYHNCKAAVKFMNGNTEQTEYDPGMCVGYIEGFTESGVLSGAASSAYCFDADTSTGVIIRLYVQFMETNPKLMDAPRFIGLAQALSANYPCKQTSGK